MTRDDILRVMREFLGPESENWAVDEALLEEWLPFLQALAAAAAVAERDKLIADGWRQCAQGQKTTQFCAVAEQARQEEREWLAAAIERQARSMSDHFETRWLHEIAAAVRARGNK